MKKIFTFCYLLISFTLSAQIKVLNGGNVIMGQPVNPNNFVLIGNPTPLYCPGKLQIKSFALPALVVEQWNNSNNWGWASISRANQLTTKHWIVDYFGSHNFYVTSSGITYTRINFYKGSDSIFKFNVNNITNPYQKLMLLRGVTYQFKPSALCRDCMTDTLVDSATTQPVHYGFIAQELERVIPEVVTTLPDSTKAVEYTEIIPLLLEGIKYQAQQIDSLKNTITQVENNSNIQNDYQAQQIDSLRATVTQLLNSNTANNYQAQINTLEATIANMQTAISQINYNNTVNNYQAQIDALQAQITSLNYNNTVNNYQAQITAMQTQLNQCCSLINNNTYGADITTLEILLANLQNQVEQCCSTNTINSKSGKTTQDNLGVEKNTLYNISKAELFQNIPNPFNENSTIKYSIPDLTKNSYIMIYDMQGKQLKKYSLTKGSSQILIQANEFSAGMYLYTLIVDNKEIDTKRMIVTD